jgi:3-hydroxyacyl-CoA dehydrogenase
LPAKEGPEERHVMRATEGLKSLPAPPGVADDAALIQQANYEEHMDVPARLRLDHRHR